MSINLALMASGRGSNLKAILTAIAQGKLDAHATVLVCNKPEAPAIEIARSFKVPVEVIANAGLTRNEHEEKILQALSQYKFDYIILAGYMRILSAQFLRHFRDPRGFFRAVNIHNSLLPSFPGTNAYEDAFNYGVKVAGVTVHLLDEEVDHGPILAQEAFPRLDADTLDTFMQRGLSIEHQLYPKVLQMLAENKIPILLKETAQA